ncbi:MAG: hypothetical protein KDE54_31400, partial [Caldilineaceae bacterium]|nr:hypothetical protein [Caldilineaceae bacterium]
MIMIDIPTDRPHFESEIATYWFEDDGILVSLSKDVKRTVENIAANVALVKRITDNKRAPLLIYLTNSPVPDKATRQFSTAQLPTVYTAMAMIADRGLTKLIMNLLFRFQSPPIPMKNFTDIAEARAWL